VDPLCLLGDVRILAVVHIVVCAHDPRLRDLREYKRASV